MIIARGDGYEFAMRNSIAEAGAEIACSLEIYFPAVIFRRRSPLCG
jgi:hypothetical protein